LGISTYVLNPELENMNRLTLDKNAEKDTKNDHKKELKETQQEIMIDLAVKTNNFLERLKEQAKKDRVRM
jgi:hypothetical protein